MKGTARIPPVPAAEAGNWVLVPDGVAALALRQLAARTDFTRVVIDGHLAAITTGCDKAFCHEFDSFRFGSKIELFLVHTVRIENG